MLMYGIYNAETLEKLITAVHKMHDSTAWNENYLLVNLILGIIGLYLKMELAIMP